MVDSEKSLEDRVSSGKEVDADKQGAGPKYTNPALRFMQQHKLLTFLGTKAVIAGIAFGVGYSTGAQVDAHVLVNEGSFLEQIIDYMPKALSVSGPSLLTRVALDIALLPGPAYLSNIDAYNKRLTTFLKKLGKLELATVAFDGVVSSFVLATMLSAGMPYALAVAANGKATVIPSALIQLYLYKKMLVVDANGSKSWKDGVKDLASYVKRCLLHGER